MLATTTVTAGSVASSTFKYASVTAFTLTAGNQYFIGGRDTLGDGDSYITSVSNLTTDSAITYIGSAVSTPGAGFGFPSSINNTTTGGRFGANFQFTDLGLNNGVPEPASWALMIGGFGMAGAAMRRRRSVTVRYA